MPRVGNTPGRLLRETNEQEGTIPGFTPQFFDKDGYPHEVRPDDPYPTGDYGMTEGGVWVPKKVSDDGTTLAQLTGSYVEEKVIDAVSVPAGEATEARLHNYKGERYAWFGIYIDVSNWSYRQMSTPFGNYYENGISYPVAEYESVSTDINYAPYLLIPQMSLYSSTEDLKASNLSEAIELYPKLDFHFRIVNHAEETATISVYVMRMY
ncbi:hypothetical protein [Lentibacillus salicampi]|uniref:Uncharacterized protein n=1 Tax=Lentibacillus salicampi TaxID=175306 RepID=A0A4Y9A8M5_9BACI|nr:hypothetical protein [Lentibacillus salicampi]TFJ92133.1 hypothetical protein E4U82_13715 [Lentibacillus salicampi]